MLGKKNVRTLSSLLFLLGLLVVAGFAQTPAWRAVAPEGALPPPRSGHTMIYDEANGRAVIYGGQDASEISLGDAYALDLTPESERWSPLAPSGPAPRSRFMASAVYDAANQRMILFGGANAIIKSGQVVRTFLNDIWSLDLTPGQETWTEIKPAGPAPAPRYMHSAVYDAESQRMVIFGGGTYDGAWRLRNDTWALDLTPGKESWIPLDPTGLVPKPKNPYRAVYVPTPKDGGKAPRMIIFGGWNGRVALNDTYALDLTPKQEQWSKVRADGYDPDVRFAHTMIYDTASEKIIIFSGWEWGGLGYHNDTWALDINADPELWTEWMPAGTLPTPRDFSNAIYDTANRQMVIFGGRNFNDTHALTLP